MTSGAQPTLKEHAWDDVRGTAQPPGLLRTLVLPPYPRPSEKPAARATTFFRAPHSSTPARRVGVCTKHGWQRGPVSAPWCQPRGQCACATTAGWGGGGGQTSLRGAPIGDPPAVSDTTFTRNLGESNSLT
jgi:hypothetical protein